MANTKTRTNPLATLTVVELIGRELNTLRAWLSKDPQTPYRREAAARLRQLADELERSV